MRDPGELLALVVAGAVPVLAYLAVGLWLARALRVAAGGSERLAVAYVLGTGAASLAILGLRSVGAPVPLWALALVALSGVPALRASATGPPLRESARARGLARAADAASIFAAALTFAAALGPETFWDGFEYHLPMARAWTEGPIRALPAFLDSELRAGIDLLYVPAVAAGWPDSAAAVSAGFACALAALIRAEASRRATPAAGALAGFFALVVPFTLENAPSAYADLGVGATGFAALLAADRWSRTGARDALPLCAVCLGFAANAKLHAAALVPAALAIVAFGGRRPSGRQLALAAAAIAAITAPWFAKAALTTGNLLFPLFADRLGAGPTTPEVLALRSFRLGTDFAGSLFLYPVSLFLGANPHVSGLLGPLPLALAPFAWHRLARPTAVLVATVAVLFVLQIAYAPAVRFGAPLVPFLAVAAAVGGARIARSGPAARGVLAAGLALLAVHHGAAALSRYAPRVVALREPASYEARVFPDQIALREMVSGAEPVVAIPQGAVLWMSKPVYLLQWERNGELFFSDLAWKGKVVRRRTPPDEALALLRRRGVRSLVLDVKRPLPEGGGIGHRTVDRWIHTGDASLATDAPSLPARGGRVWVRVDLVP